MKTQTWNTIRVGSKIKLLKDKMFNSFEGKIKLKAGKYIITGFWGNVCNVRSLDNINLYIPSIQLKKFENIN